MPEIIAFAYLGIKLSSIVEKCHADLMQTSNLTRVVFKAFKYTAANITSTDQAVLDFS